MEPRLILAYSLMLLLALAGAGLLFYATRGWRGYRRGQRFHRRRRREERAEAARGAGA